MKTIWKVLAWIFAVCGLITYLSAWAEIWFGWKMWGATTDVLFFDAIAAGIFGLFFLAWGKVSAGG